MRQVALGLSDPRVPVAHSAQASPRRFSSCRVKWPCRATRPDPIRRVLGPRSADSGRTRLPIAPGLKEAVNLGYRRVASRGSLPAGETPSSIRCPIGRPPKSPGEMAERSKAHAWKACVGQPTVGSNPTLSARFARWSVPVHDLVFMDGKAPSLVEANSVQREGSEAQFGSDAQNSCAPVAQLDRASACGAEGRTFESCRARHFFRSPEN